MHLFASISIMDIKRGTMYLGRERDLEVCVCVCVSGRAEDCVEILSRTLCMNLIT